MKITVIRSARKTFCLEMRFGELLVRVPNAATQVQVDAFLEKEKSWIEKQERRASENAEFVSPLTGEEIRELSNRAKTVFAERVAFYAPKIGVTYGRITVRHQTSRWGSCSGKGNLSFNCLLLLAPQEVLDSVVVHELCHRKHMNHSKRFYAEISRVFQNYDTCRQWLKENGAQLLLRLKPGEGEKC